MAFIPVHPFRSFTIFSNSICSTFSIFLECSFFLHFNNCEYRHIITDITFVLVSRLISSLKSHFDIFQSHIPSTLSFAILMKNEKNNFYTREKQIINMKQNWPNFLVKQKKNNVQRFLKSNNKYFLFKYCYTVTTYHKINYKNLVPLQNQNSTSES